jgi:Peptidase M15
MRYLIGRAHWALTILSLPFLILGVAMSTSSGARADRAIDEATSGSFAVFGEKSRGGNVRSNLGAGADRASSRPSITSTTPRRAKAVARAASEDDDTPAPRRRAKGRQVASLGGGDYTPPRPSRSLSGGGNVRWVANSGCLDGGLRSAVSAVAANYGSVTVSSTCRSAGHNARVGGAPKSYHLSGDAVDFRVSGDISGAARYLAGLGGGYKHYGGGLFHIDNGPRRSF